jgi:hypothetical protein
MKMKRVFVLVMLVLVCACHAKEDDAWSSDYETTSTSTSSGSSNGCDDLFSLLASFGDCLLISWGTAVGAYVGAYSDPVVSDEELALGGSAFVSPTDSTCCPADPGVTLEWSNEATGESGTALSTVSATGASPENWNHQWQAKIRLRPGLNRITVTAYDRSGNWAKRSVTVRREP